MLPVKADWRDRAHYKDYRQEREWVQNRSQHKERAKRVVVSYNPSCDETKNHCSERSGSSNKSGRRCYCNARKQIDDRSLSDGGKQLMSEECDAEEDKYPTERRRSDK